MRIWTRFAFLALALVSTGCIRPADPAAMLSEQADPATLGMIEQAGDRVALVLVLRPARWAALGSTLRSLLGGAIPAWMDRALDAPDALAAVDAALQDTPFRPGGLEGLDLTRPIVAGLFEPRLNDLVLAARAVVPGPPELLAKGVEGVRHRVLLPATHAETLRDSLVRLAGRFGLKPEIEEAGDGRVVFALPDARGFVALVPGTGPKPVLRVELLTNEHIPYQTRKKRHAAWLAMLDEPTDEGRTPLTPARVFAASRSDLLVLHVRPWVLRDLAGQMGTRMLVQALEQANPAYKQMLLAKGLSEAAKSTLLMSPAGAEIDDMALALDLDRGLRLSACMSLTAEGARILRAGVDRGRLPLQAEQKPHLSTFWSRLDTGAMLAAASTPPALAGAGELAVLSDTIMECGPLCTLHLGGRTPFGLLKTVLELTEQDLTGLPPGALSVALKDLRQSPRERPLQLAAAATYRQAAGVRQVRQALAALEKNMGDKPRVRLFVEPQDEAQVVKLGIGIDPRQVFGSRTVAPPDDVIAAITVDLGMIANLVARQSPEAAAVLDQLDDLRARSRLAGRAVIGEMLVGMKNGEPLAYNATGDYRRFDWETPGAAEAGTRGAGCMREVTRSMIEGFGALAYAAPEQRSLLMARLLEEIEEPLACAAGEPDTRERARKTRRLLVLYVADLLLDDFHQERALQVLDRACRQGHDRVCRKADAVRSLPAIEPAAVEAPCPLEHPGGVRMVRVPTRDRAASLPDYQDALDKDEPPLLAVDKAVRFERLAGVIDRLAPDHAEAGLLVRGGYGRPGVIRVGLSGGACGKGSQARRGDQPDAKKNTDHPPALADFADEAQSPGRPRVVLVLSLEGEIGRLFFAHGPGMCFATGRDQTPDDCESLDALAEEIAQLRDAFPGGFRVYLDAEPDVAYARVVRVIAAVLCDREKNTYMQEHGTRLNLGPVPQGVLKKATTSPPGDTGHASEVEIGSLFNEASGLAGIGAGGHKGGGSGGKGPVRIRPGKTMVRGSLDKDVIRRVIRKSQNQVRYCYERALVNNPELAGRITVKFVISAEGNVIKAAIASTSLENEGVEKCVVRVVRRMRFPAPQGGGIVVVNYPFIFKAE